MRRIFLAAVAVVLVATACAGNAGEQTGTPPEAVTVEPTVPRATSPAATSPEPTSSAPLPTVVARTPVATEPEPADGFPIGLRFAVDPVTSDDFSATVLVERSVLVDPQRGAAKEFVDAWIDLWFEGPTADERAQGLIGPLDDAFIDPACTEPFNSRLAGTTLRNRLLIVTLCDVSTAGVGADARILSSFAATTAEIPFINRAVLLSADGEQCFGDLSGDRQLRCLLPDFDWPAAPDNCPDAERPPAKTLLEVTNVAPDDPDGGLVLHSGPGVAAPEVGVATWVTRGLVATLRCTVVADGGVWWELLEQPDDPAPVWANAAFLRAEQPSPLLDTPCDDFELEALGYSTSGSTRGRVEAPRHDHIAALSVDESNPYCTVVTIEMGEGWNTEPPERPESVTSRILESAIEVTNLDDPRAGYYGLRFHESDRGTSGGAALTGINVDAFFEHQFVAFGGGTQPGAVFVSSTEQRGAGQVTLLTGSTKPPRVAGFNDPARVVVAIETAPLPNPIQLLEADGSDPAGGPTAVVRHLDQIGPGTIRVSGWGIAFEARAEVSVVAADRSVLAPPRTVAMGNPSVAWSPFEVTIDGLAPGTHTLVVNTCTQCDDASASVPFTIE